MMMVFFLFYPICKKNPCTNPATNWDCIELQDARRLAKAKKNIVHDFFQTCPVQQLWFSACIIFTDFILTALFNCQNTTNDVYKRVTFE